jgi:hypothetical protein
MHGRIKSEQLAEISRNQWPKSLEYPADHQHPQRPAHPQQNKALFLVRMVRVWDNKGILV